MAATKDVQLESCAKQLMTESLRVLSNRRGFNWWWDEIGSSSRTEIKRELTRAFTKIVKAYKERDEF